MDLSRRLLACLSDTSRYRIVRLLRGEERCVTEIARAVGLSQSCTTRHLQALARGHIVRRRREGKRVLFRLDDRDPNVRGLLAWLGARAPGPGAAGAGGAGRTGRRQARAGGDDARLEGKPGAERESAPGGVGGEGHAAPVEVPRGSAGSEEPGAPEEPAWKPPPLRPGDLEDYLL